MIVLDCFSGGAKLADNPRSAGVPPFVIQEEFDRYIRNIDFILLLQHKEAYKFSRPHALNIFYVF